MDAANIVDMSGKPFQQMAEKAYSLGFSGLAAMLYWNAIKRYAKETGFEAKEGGTGSYEDYKSILKQVGTLETDEILSWMEKGKTPHQIDLWLLKKYGKCIGKLMT